MTKPRNKLRYPKYIKANSNASSIELIDCVVVRKTTSWSWEAMVDQMMLMLQYMMQHPDPLVAPVLQCEKLSPEKYSYDLPLMAKLTYSECRLIEYASDLDKGYPSLWKKQKKLHLPGRYKHQKLMWFLRKVIMQDLYRDLHCGNVMRDQYGNYRLIDLDSFDPIKYLLYNNK